MAIVVTLARQLWAGLFITARTHPVTSVLLSYFVYILVRQRKTAIGARPRDDLPGPEGHPLIGNTLDLAKRKNGSNYQIQTAYHEKYGPVYAMTVFGLGRIINVTDPEMVDHVLRANFWNYIKGDYFKTVLEPLLGEGIFGVDGEHWKWQRKLASHIFNVNSFRTYTSSVFCGETQLVEAYFNKIADNPDKVVNLQDIFYKYTLDSFGQVAFGQSFGCLVDPEQDVEFALAFDRLNNSLAERFQSPLWKLGEWLSGRSEEIKKDVGTVHGFAYDVIQKRREQMNQNVHKTIQEQARGDSEGPGNRIEEKHKKDLLQLFMEAEGDSGEPLSDKMLKDILLNFGLAGRDTTAQALTWMFYLIHRSGARQEILEKLEEETDRVLKGGNPTYESTKQQKYAEACLYETLRLYPPVPQNMKVCVEDDILPGGVKIYKGEKFGWSTWAMGRSTANWGPDACEFKPERWLNGDKPSQAKFASFHHGPRTCLGQQFATIEAITIMSMLVQKFRFELMDPKFEPSYSNSLTLPMAGGLPVRVLRRQ
ncbi:hypothetical protein BGW38_000355 [Lunasporangiospora selenospora]|uniref:Cytochrome P450 n=1 Tax=Lunasporangiospora selenospora TaxID=979761 RepID=A0A9P6FUY9_9FUNG|nr:hypothetical protein BGW38_000355 [Lunasporangiospora selenospora]